MSCPLASLALLLVVLVVPAAWGALPPRVAQEADAVAVPSTLPGEVNAFGIALYQQIAGEKPEANLFLSPINIAAALRMAAEGAEGETRSQMRGVLRYAEGDGEGGGSGFAGLIQTMEPPSRGMRDKEPVYTLTMAQAVWLQKDYPFEEKYVQGVRREYLATVEPIDFAQSAQAAGTINNWVEKATNERIQDLIPEDAVSNQTRMVITTAIYFLGTWANTFDEDDTREQPFTLASGEEIEHPLMADEMKGVAYLDGEGFQLLSLRYKGDALSMVVVLPDEADGLPALERELTAERLDGWIGEAQPQTVMVYLPKFEMTVATGLNDPLVDMGMTDAFSDSAADFSGITTAEGLYISAVLHKAFVKVDEKGTEAAAATAVAIQSLSERPMDEPPTFRADHPFLFAIRHDETGTLLFLGRVMDPW